MPEKAQSRLTRFNNQWGFPIQRPTRGGSRKQVRTDKFVCSIPVFPLVAHSIRYGIKSTRQTWHQHSKQTRKRIVLCSSIVGIPVVLLLDIFATLVTQPIGLYRDHQKEKGTPNTIKALDLVYENETTNSDMDEEYEADSNSDENT